MLRLHVDNKLSSFYILYFSLDDDVIKLFWRYFHPHPLTTTSYDFILKYSVIFFSKTCWCRSICLTSDGQCLRWVLDLQQSAVWTLQPGPGLLTLTLLHCRTCLNIHGEILLAERKALKSRQDLEFRVESAKAILPLKGFRIICKFTPDGNLSSLLSSYYSLNEWLGVRESLSLCPHSSSSHQISSVMMIESPAH